MGLEPFFTSELVDSLVEVTFEAGSGSDVDDFAAMNAQEVVVMLGEVLGELVTGELIVGSHATDDPGNL